MITSRLTLYKCVVNVCIQRKFLIRNWTIDPIKKKDSSVRFMHHNPSKLDHKQPDPDHLKAQDKRPQAIFVSGRISETFS